MFGYILPDKPELKIREYEIYRAYYCGVCKAIQEGHGNLPRLTLTYDSAFLALLLSSLFEEQTPMEIKGCILHPINKRKIISNGEILDYVADMNVLLSWFNFMDKWQDDNSKIAYGAILALKSAYRRIKVKYPHKSQTIIDQLTHLSQLEKDHCDSIDEAAEPFARLMEEVIQYPFVRNDAVDSVQGGSRTRVNEKKIDDNTKADRYKRNETVLPWMGYHIGKWIYTIDALDDLEKDIQNKSYNPLLYQYKYQGEDVAEFRAGLLQDIEFNLFSTLSEIARSFELLNFNQNKDIAGNIIYLGMQKKTETILGRGKCVERPIRSVGNQQGGKQRGNTKSIS